MCLNNFSLIGCFSSSQAIREKNLKPTTFKSLQASLRTVLRAMEILTFYTSLRPAYDGAPARRAKKNLNGLGSSVRPFLS